MSKVIPSVIWTTWPDSIGILQCKAIFIERIYLNRVWIRVIERVIQT